MRASLATVIYEKKYSQTVYYLGRRGWSSFKIEVNTITIIQISAVEHGQICGPFFNPKYGEMSAT